MPRFGADESFASTTSGGVFDSSGNAVVSADNEFGGSPLGPAALAQTLFSVANGTFNLLPPTIEEPISNENPLPYWSAPSDNSDGEMTAQVVFDTTSNTYSLRMDPGTALSGDTLSITTRSAVISDDNLSLRQKAIATLAKVGTYAGTTQVNLKLDATYYDHTGTQLSTQAIGTVFDNGTVSSITGFTTAGTAAVGISAAYVDLTFTMTATANVTSGIAFDIDTILLQTSQGGGGASSFLVTERFNSSDTWTRPTGVEYLVAVIGLSGGSGGQGGTASFSNNSVVGESSFGGNPGVYGFIRNVYVGDQTTISVGVGAGGNGGVGGTATKSGTAASVVTTAPTSASVGGATTFGSYLTCTTAASGTVGTVTSTVPFGDSVFTNAGSTNTATTFRANSYWQQNGFSSMPYQDAYPLAGGNGGAGECSAGTTGTASGTSVVAGGPVNNVGLRVLGGNGGGSGYIAGEGGRSGIIRVDNSGTFAYAGTTLASGTATSYSAGSAQAGAGGGGGAAAFGRFNAAVNLYIKGGDGGNASANSGSGGGGGGPARCGGTVTISGSSGTAIGGNGGNGGAGFVIIAYVA